MGLLSDFDFLLGGWFNISLQIFLLLNPLDVAVMQTLIKWGGRRGNVSADPVFLIEGIDVAFVEQILLGFLDSTAPLVVITHRSLVLFEDYNSKYKLLSNRSYDGNQLHRRHYLMIGILKITEISHNHI